MRFSLLFVVCVCAYGQTIAPVSVSPSAGSGGNANFTFTFNDTAGYQDLSVVDILINNVLDGRQACYIAFYGNTVSLVDDGGVFYTSMTLPGTGTLQNSQCTLNGGIFAGNGNTLTLNLSITFASGFAGNKVMYLAARSATGNSGWQALGTWNVPGSSGTGPAVGRMDPARSGGFDQTYTFSFTNAAMANVLINSAIDGRQACYVAFVSSGPGVNAGALYLIDDGGDSAGPYVGMLLPAPLAKTISNSQCTIDGGSTSVTWSGSTFTLTLGVTFAPAFAGNRVVYAAARSDPQNSGWQAVGSVSVGLDSRAPVITQITPAFVTAVPLTLILTVSGSNFQSAAPCAQVCGFACPGSSVINFAHTDLLTQVAGLGQLQATVPASLLGFPFGSVDVTVRNPVVIQCQGNESHVSAALPFTMLP